MSLNELLPAVEQLSRQDKLRLMHFLLLAVAKEEGCNLESTDAREPEDLLLKELASDDRVSEDLLLKELASTEAVVWSPYEAYEAAQTLSDLLAAVRKKGDA